ncbi:hypothetical protein [Paenibacillus beijingensis]|uniref:Uncharacterized protein n=1 Tax=Paenibacillus beijingensis TaxID=1126833 RepID=A0A0D5NGW6_9BACL|nr:hypothetical protein [Paenibacillus beijingensis]AJY74148.1 hypothetical protein VN24_05605 [Paenibacillus beijingensis]
MRIIVYTLIPIFYIWNLFVHLLVVDIILMILAIISILLSLKHIQSLYLASTIVFLGLGLLIFLTSHVQASEWIRAFHPMMGVLGIFLVLPFIQGVVRTGRFDKSMKRIIEFRALHLGTIYRRTSLSTYLLSIFLTIATLPIGYQSFGKTTSSVLQDHDHQRFFSSSMLRAYSLALFWSPVELLVVTSIDYTGGNYLHIMPVMLLLGLVYLVADWRLVRNKDNIPLDPVPERKHFRSPRKDLIKVCQLLLAVIILLILVVLVNALLKQGMMIAITIVLIPFSLCWSFLLKKLPLFWRTIQKNWAVNIKKTAHFHAVFLSAGFFITMAQQSDLFGYLSGFLKYQMNHIPLFFFFLLLSLLFWLMSFCGFHSVVTIILLTRIILPFSQGMEDSLALLFIGTSISLLMVSPFNIATSIMAHQLNASPINIIRWNSKFAISFMLGVVVVAYGLTFF